MGMLHRLQSVRAGKSFLVKADIPGIGGKKVLVEDWWDRLAKCSWKANSMSGVGVDSDYRERVKKDGALNNDEVLYVRLYSGGTHILVNEAELGEQVV